MSLPDDPLRAGDPRVRARQAAALGHRGRWPRGTSQALTDLVLTDPDTNVRRAALTALVRRARLGRAVAVWELAMGDADDGARRAAVTLAPLLAARSKPEFARVQRAGLVAPLLARLDDPAPLVAEAAAFAVGELVAAGVDFQTARGALDALMRHAADHSDPLVREACVAALGTLRAADVPDADEALPVLLVAVRDKPAIRRRAVIALAAFDGPDADRALHEALTDRDWQVRQLAEDLTADA